MYALSELRSSYQPKRVSGHRKIDGNHNMGTVVTNVRYHNNKFVDISLYVYGYYYARALTVKPVVQKKSYYQLPDCCC